MALQYLLGSSGSGKTTRLYEQLIQEAVANPTGRYLVIVPEQFTMSTQAQIVRLHPNHGTFNIDIVSFPRLAHKVFGELGTKTGKVLADTGKSLLIRKVLSEEEEELKSFKRHIHQAGFVEEVKSAISEMLQYGVTSDTLREVAGTEEVGKKKVLSQKLVDLAHCYDGFRKEVEDRYIASEEVLDLLAQVAENSKLLDCDVITLDGFTGFTPVQYRLIEKLLKKAKNLRVVLTMDATAIREKNIHRGMEELFALSKDTMAKLGNLARNLDIPEEVYSLSKKDEAPVRLCDSPSLQFLEAHLFRNDGARYEKDCDIHIYEADFARDEVAYTIATMKQLIHDKKYHYRDFAIVTAGLDGYAQTFANLLKQNQIPVFLDYKRSLLGNPASNLLRAGCRLVEENFSYESVFTMLKTGLMNFKQDDVDQLENYCLATGLRGYTRYAKEWTTKTKVIRRGESFFKNLELSRKKLVKMISPFYQAMKKAKTVEDYVDGLYLLMDELHLEVQLEKLAESYGDARPDLFGEYSQVYDKIVDMLEQFVSLLGTEKMDITCFREILEAGLGELKVGLIPQMQDAVVVGDLERTRLEQVKVLFIVGANDDVIPKKNGGSGVLSDFDKEVLKGHSIELSLPAREQGFIQRFYLYQIMTKPSDALYLTYSKMSNEGRSKRRSYLIFELLRMFSKCTIASASQMDGRLSLVSIPKANLTYSWVEKESIGEDSAKELYGEDFQTHITGMEKFASCAFAHFLQYGLKLEERELYEVGMNDLGTLYHDCLESFTKPLIEEKRSFTDLTEEERKDMVHYHVEKVLEDFGGDLFTSTNRRMYMTKRLEERVNRTIWAVTEQLKKGLFVPVKVEEEFFLGEILKGRIDRIDLCDRGDTLYFKVIDYKTGSAEFSLDQTYYGLKIQLLTYMNAVLKEERKLHPEKKVVPAGMFYYHIQDPFVEEKSSLEEVRMDQLLKLRLDGVVNSDPEVVELMDQEKKGDSIAIPVKFKKEGTYDLSEKRDLSTERMNLLGDYVMDGIHKNYEKVLQGEVSKNPYQLQSKKACTYCNFRSICGFDEKHAKYRTLPTLSNDEIWRNIETWQTSHNGQENNNE
ncbi:MAG: PD-(D/E)XK nuclease family protein [Lachnospiraceae bacterium]|nr:PD-(D/E)XK nuclease family protein [Lachnospiraceae bacterium]